RGGGQSYPDRRKGGRNSTTTSRLLSGSNQNHAILQRSRPVTSKTLIRGGTIGSMDPEIANLTGAVLTEDAKIVPVGPNISADAEVIDASDSIVIPGFVDTH